MRIVYGRFDLPECTNSRIGYRGSSCLIRILRRLERLLASVQRSGEKIILNISSPCDSSCVSYARRTLIMVGNLKYFPWMTRRLSGSLRTSPIKLGGRLVGDE